MRTGATLGFFRRIPLPQAWLGGWCLTFCSAPIPPSALVTQAQPLRGAPVLLSPSTCVQPVLHFLAPCRKRPIVDPGLRVDRLVGHTPSGLWEHRGHSRTSDCRLHTAGLECCQALLPIDAHILSPTHRSLGLGVPGGNSEGWCTVGSTVQGQCGVHLCGRRRHLAA